MPVNLCLGFKLLLADWTIFLFFITVRGKMVLKGSFGRKSLFEQCVIINKSVGKKTVRRRVEDPAVDY